MKPSEICYSFIKSFEGLFLKGYPDPGSEDGLPITIGYGTTLYEDGRKVQLDDVITKERATQLLQWEVDKKAQGVDNLLKGISLNQNQYDALVSFAYNCGLGNLKSSTLLKKVKANPNDPDIRAQFLRFNKASGKVMRGLTRRREAEANLYFGT